jgi:hypothetical protein
LVRSAGKNCAAISAHVDHERRRLGIDPLTGKYRPVIFEGFEYTYEYRTNSDAGALGAHPHACHQMHAPAQTT